MASSLPTAARPCPGVGTDGEQPQEMSAEELKARLFHSFQAKGILDHLKVRQSAAGVPLAHGVCSSVTKVLHGSTRMRYASMRCTEQRGVWIT